MKNLELMTMCILAGFNMYNEPWINTYLDNPDFIEYTDYYVKMATTRQGASSPTTSSDNEEDSDAVSEGDDDNSAVVAQLLMSKTDQELADLLNMDEYYFERFHITRNRGRGLSSYPSAAVTAADSKRKNAELARRIYTSIKYFYTNPLSLKELARIQIRKSLLAVDYRMKYRIEEDLHLPKRLKDYLLLKEFIL